MNLESDIFLKVNDVQGADLLDPARKGIDPALIKVFYVKQNGDKMEFNKPKLDYPKGYRLITPGTDGAAFYKIQLFLNAEYLNSDNISYTEIEWSSGDTDIVKSQFLKQNNSLIVNKIWVDDQLKWESNNEKLISLIK